MANYTSYRAGRIRSVNIDSGAICNSQLAAGVRCTYGQQWVYGDPGQCTAGCCCYWTVPSDVKVLKFELWGAGGNGHGSCSCDRCQHHMGSSGGSYNTQTVCSAPSNGYTLCAGGVYRCLSNECSGCNGCTTYANGSGLSNFCACGGGSGCANGSWTDSCHTYMDNCQNGSWNGGHFANFTHNGPFVASGPYTYPGDACHCWKRLGYSSGGIIFNTGRVDQFMQDCWIRCGCWTVPYTSGGQGGKSTYCGQCCGQGGTGGSGVVKITYF